MNQKCYWVYMLLCENGHFYTGYTVDLERRYREHLMGTPKCKYTKAFKPTEIAQSWQVSNKSLAMKLEYYIKKLSHDQKKGLSSKPNTPSRLVKKFLMLNSL